MKICGAMGITLVCGLLPAVSLAQAPTDQTSVLRFEISEEAFQDVENSADLVAAVREHLTLDLTMPLDEPILISIRGVAGGPPHFLYPNRLRAQYESDAPLHGSSYALAVRESHGEDFPPDGDEWVEFDAEDWDEDAAWNALVRALDIGLPESSTEFETPRAGRHVGLRVKGVHVREFTLTDEDSWWDYHECCLEDFQGPVFQIEPDASFQSAVME
ncbi:MAG: hypothetical protein ACRD3V_10095, partial [Vicinamibacteria bacterium]